MKRFFFIFVFISFSLCFFANEKAFIFLNKDFHFIFNDYEKNYQILKKRMYRDFFEVKENEIAGFISFKMEADKIIAKNKGGLLVADDFLAPVLMKDEGIFTNKKFKLFTYNVQKSYKFKTYLPIFSVDIEEKILAEEILKIYKKNSKKKDLSDCAIFINRDYDLPLEVVKYFETKKNKVAVFNSQDSKNKLIELLKNDLNLKVVVFFAYKNNEIINEIEKKLNKNLVFCEVMTDYGKAKKKVRHRVGIRWDKAINEGTRSKAFKKFINLKNDKKTITRYIAKNKDVVYTETNFGEYFKIFDATSDLKLFNKLFNKGGK
ncbi:MAG TPA: hypothetical protein PLO89_08115 [Spirochaetota bacterium]|nr:hypothetical protein [Spirochaetota bacterium]